MSQAFHPMHYIHRPMQAHERVRTLAMLAFRAALMNTSDVELYRMLYVAGHAAGREMTTALEEVNYLSPGEASESDALLRRVSMMFTLVHARYGIDRMNARVPGRLRVHAVPLEAACGPVRVPLEDGLWPGYR
jgi:hypothetical protein